MSHTCEKTCLDFFLSLNILKGIERKIETQIEGNVEIKCITIVNNIYH